MERGARLRVTLLGPFQVSRGDTVLTVSGARLQGLLVRLALAGGHAVEPGVLVDAIWAEEPPSGPAHALQALVSRLRRALTPTDPARGVVAQVMGGYRLAVDAADVDALRFERLTAAGREGLRAGDPEAAVAALSKAVALWGDHPGAEPAVIAAVAPTVATRLAQVSIEAVADLADAELSLGRAELAAARLTGLLAEQTVNERAAALLMDALAAQGRQAEALAVYERVRETLADALGADPGTALRERHLRLLRPGRPLLVPDACAGGAPAGSPAASSAPAGSAVSSRASVPTAEATARATSATEASAAGMSAAGMSPAGANAEVGSPAAATGRNAGGQAGGRAATEPDRIRPTNLPAPLTSFIGRDDDLTRIGTLLTTGRLVTVLGPGGAGKTRLALEAARRHHHAWRDGAWLIDLVSVTEPAKIATAVLTGTGLRGGAMLDARKRIEGDELHVLVGELGGRESLLLVDNCEHLIDAVARLVSALLPRCPGLRVLATSREPLAVDGEALVPLAPLALPDPDDGVEQARRAASVRLFTERAAAVRPGFDVDETSLPDIVRVVRGLDGLPLALELAAARLRTLSLPDLADGLSDRFRLLTTGSRTAPPRHRTLRAVIAWSWELLGEHERTVAERISILPGGVTPASATAVCAGTTVPTADIPDLLATLVDRSLLQLAPATGRYRMLETIREYGADRLTDTGDLGTARDLAAAHFTQMMSRQDPLLRGPGQLMAMKVIGAEYDNTLAALRHLCAARDSHGATTLALTLIWYWQMFGRHSDAAYWLGEVLAATGGGPTPERDCVRAAYLLNRADILSGITAGEAADDRTEMRELADRLLAHPELPSHYRVFGPVLLFLQKEEAALAIFQRLADGDDVWLSGLAHMFQAEIAENAGALMRMRVHVKAALARFRQAGDRWGRAATLPMSAHLRRYDDLDGALADLREARTLAGEFGSLSLGDQLYSDLRWIDVHLRRGDTDRAMAVIDSARERALHASSADMLVLVDVCEADFRVRLGDLDRAGDLIDAAERGLLDETAFATDHVRTLVGGARAALCLALGDLPGVDKALREAYAAALATRDLPILSLVTVNTAALAETRGRQHESAVLLGAAARLRGTHDHTDPQVRELTRRGEAALGGEEFAAAYAKGWELDGKTAVAVADPARLSGTVDG
ncbi:BTAD domain-containing putative transcriptional regulator [Streptomyces sp. NEAU-YJ-81]|uniref:AfsR/SARP family transcriptional regulator n=1 Tax=Streptomyces sp. NEAU-YJ-81 TaxID=2820288 RepID=UPI001ABBFE37|nr:BTAD domain-containing putative transcriptional regulator [Streptomyces sp. NEAU-YJ-81]MBO3679263.1 AfsR/SARP family transcriptional regulator [Streptomyces sp. NEAU-YJ-81]